VQATRKFHILRNEYTYLKGDYVVIYTEQELSIIDQYQKFEPKQIGLKYGLFIKEIPSHLKRYKCYNCFTILNSEQVVDGKCTNCGDSDHIILMCPIDHNRCSHTLTTTTEKCPVCGDAICPQCGDHNVLVAARTTGKYCQASQSNNKKNPYGYGTCFGCTKCL
jgi:hypothetical protein